MSYVTLRGYWCNIVVVNVHASTEDKSDDMKDSFYEALECVFDQFLKYSHENFVRRCQCKSKERRYFETNNQE